MERSTTMTLTLTIAHTEHEIEATVGYTYTPGRPARYYPWPGDPPEPAEVEVLSVSIGATDIMHFLSQDQIEALCESLMENIEADDPEGDEADRKYDEWKDTEMEKENGR